MARRKRPDAKREALAQYGSLNPHPEKVRDELFVASDYFDARDVLQVKYEMLRRVRVDGESITEAAASFGLSRPTYYEAQAAFESGGLAGLIRKKPGPRRAHKLSEEVMDFLEEERSKDPELSPPALVQLVRERFGLSVHLRSVQRALKRRERKQ